jgi:predicted transport protein
MPLFRVSDTSVQQIKQSPYPRERNLQCLFERNLEALLGVRFVASEFTTGDRQRGRIDTLGLDQDGYPTIIEYKRTSKENIINQGLFYLDWLVDHKGDFTMAAHKMLETDVRIDWSHPRLILVAESFSEYDKYAVNRIGANIELWTFRKYGDDLLFLEPLFVAAPQPTKGTPGLTTKDQIEEAAPEQPEAELPTFTIEDHKRGKSAEAQALFDALRERIFSLAEEGEITEKVNKIYIGYKHGKNFCEVRILSRTLLIWLDISPQELIDPLQIARDVRKIGHYGTGDVELKMSGLAELDSIMALVEQSFLQTV